MTTTTASIDPAIEPVNGLEEMDAALRKTASETVADGEKFQDAVSRFQSLLGTEIPDLADALAPLDDLDLADAPEADASEADASGAVASGAAFVPLTQDAALQTPAVGDGLSVSAVDVAASTRSQMLSAAVEELCEAIQVSPGVQPGQGEVRIQLKADVLAGTEVFLEAKGTTLSVAFNPATADVAEVLARNITQLEQHLAERVHNYQIATKVKRLKS